MKITKKYLQQIIKEEIESILQEDPDANGPNAGNLEDIPLPQLEKIYERCMISSGDNHEQYCGHFAKELERRTRGQHENKRITKKYLQQIIKEEIWAQLSESTTSDEFEQDVLDCAKDENKCRQDNPKFHAAVKAKVKELFGDQLGKGTIKKVRSRSDKTVAAATAGHSRVDRRARQIAPGR